jgi:hypothetical protein
MSPTPDSLPEQILPDEKATHFGRVYLKVTDLERAAISLRCASNCRVDIFSDSVAAPWRSTLRTS